ncbi:hypothetical protein NHQ30_008202 [Ciborinia camelliae]|nr:hypothetical protein NHQ30_008202 [Ciborinia camelliae]
MATMITNIDWNGCTSLRIYTFASMIGVGLGVLAHLGLFIWGEWHNWFEPRLTITYDCLLKTFRFKGPRKSQSSTPKSLSRLMARRQSVLNQSGMICYGQKAPSSQPDRGVFMTRAAGTGKSVLPLKKWKYAESLSSCPALAYHFAKTVKHVEILGTIIESSIVAGKPCQMRDLFYWLGFDIMGDFVFNKSFNMLNNQEWHHMVVRLQRALSLLGPASPAPWLIQIAFRIAPRIYQIGDWFEMTAWTHEQIGARLDTGFEKQPTPDLVHYLLEKSDEPRTAEGVRRMRGDSLNAIVAGSEPIPVVLLGLFSELARNPHQIETAYAEIAEKDITDTKVLSGLPYLNAIIQEALRLYPVLPTAGSRKTGKHGVTIAGVFIPPNTTVVNPRYSIHRREDCFEQANDFIPERWTTRREMVRNIAAYSPWGTGKCPLNSPVARNALTVYAAHHSCIARVMAIDVLRITTAQVIKKYRFSLAPGETGRRVLDDMKDQLAPNPGHLTLVFEKR